MSRGKAHTAEQRELVVILKESYDAERRKGETVSTRDPSLRVAKGLNMSLRSVRSILAEYNRTAKTSVPVLEKGKPQFRVSPMLETILRQRIRELNQGGQYVSLRTLLWMVTPGIWRRDFQSNSGEYLKENGIYQWTI